MKNKATNKKYWEFKNKTDTSADLYLYIEIASWGGGYAAHSAQSFKNELDSLGEIERLNMYINSPGGDVFEGIAIANMLKRHKATVHAYIDGIAASIASVIAMAADVIHMPSNAMLMIHNAWTYCYGNSKELRDIADRLDKCNISILQSYMSKIGDKTEEATIVQLMDKESWLTAQECFDYGLCDVLEEETSIAAKVDSTIFDLYKNVPKGLVTRSEENEPSNHVKDMELEALIARINNKLAI